MRVMMAARVSVRMVKKILCSLISSQRMFSWLAMGVVSFAEDACW